MVKQDTKLILKASKTTAEICLLALFPSGQVSLRLCIVYFHATDLLSSDIVHLVTLNLQWTMSSENSLRVSHAPSHCPIGKGKDQGKVFPVTGHEGPEGELRYRYALSLTSTLDRVGGQRRASAALPLGKTW
jgi:ABC-type branched-subunit amino acid transport system permease subunit